VSLSTHVLDTMHGSPGAGVEVKLSRRASDDWKDVWAGITDGDGRIRELGPARLEPGEYKLEFAAAPYFERFGVKAFFPVVMVSFQLDEAVDHVHVPVLLSPYGYTTYKGV